MKSKRNLIWGALVSALVLVAMLALPGTAQAPPTCQELCLADAAEDAQACLALPPSQQAACLKAIPDQLSDCLAGCHSR